MRVFIFSAFDSVAYTGEEPMRYAAIAEEFLKNGHEVYYIASSFSHVHKKFRKVSKTPDRLKVILLSTKAYNRNFSIDRVINHYRLTISLSKWLDKYDITLLPDLVIGASPPLNPNYVLARFCLKHKVPFIYDIQDLWPEEFLKVAPFKGILKLFLKSYFTMAKDIVRMSSAVIAVSNDYLDYYKSQILDKSSAVFHLGADTKNFAKPIKTSEPKKIIILGNAQYAPYILMVAKAVQNIQDVELIVCGLKEQTGKFKELIDKEKLRKVSFINWLDMRKIEQMLPQYAVGMILVNSDSKIAFPNRAFTYFSAGLPVVNTISGGELENCLSENKLGITLKFVDEQSLEEGIKYCLDNFQIQEHKRIQDFAREHFDRKDIYEQYYKTIMNYEL